MPQPGGSQTALRASNERKILEALQQTTLTRESSPVTRAQLIAETGLSSATVASVVTALAPVLGSNGGNPAPTGKRGRPSTGLQIDPLAGAVVGVQFAVGGVRAVVTDLAGRFLRKPGDPDPLEVWREPREALDQAAGTARALLDEVEAKEGIGRDRIVGVGVSVAAPVDQETGMVRAVSAGHGWAEWWARFHIAQEIQERLGWSGPVVVENDANLGALAELVDGAAARRDTALYVKWGQGIGAGIIIGGRLYQGATGMAGELGHMPLVLREGDLVDHGSWLFTDHAGKPRKCGLCGMLCLESAVSVKALLEDFDAATVAELVDRSESDPRVEEGVRQRAVHLGRVLGSSVTLLNPEVVVIGGAFKARAYALVRDSLRDGLDSSSTDAAHRTRLVPGAWSGTASLQGATAIILRNYLIDFLLRRAGL